MKYLSVTVFENCSPEILRDFYMDNDYRKQWDRTIVEHRQLQVDENNGVEFGCTIKKFPLLTPREYVLAWRLWEGKDKTFYCFIKVKFCQLSKIIIILNLLIVLICNINYCRHYLAVCRFFFIGNRKLY